MLCDTYRWSHHIGKRQAGFPTVESSLYRTVLVLVECDTSAVSQPRGPLADLPGLGGFG